MDAIQCAIPAQRPEWTLAGVFGAWLVCILLVRTLLVHILLVHILLVHILLVRTYPASLTRISTSMLSAQSLCSTILR
jgi:hypothetical protein